MRGQVFPEDWTMPREFQIRHLIGLSLYVLVVFSTVIRSHPCSVL